MWMNIKIVTKDMHNLFMYICDVLKIDTFVVGDEKQSIYTWRGAYPQAFMSIWERSDFSRKLMRKNFAQTSKYRIILTCYVKRLVIYIHQ